MRLPAAVALVAVLVMGSGRLLAQQAPPMSPEIPVNSSTTNSQGQPSIGMDATGGFVVSWFSYHEGQSDIFAQRFAADGQKDGPEFRVNTYTTGTQYASSLAANPDGSIVVVWSSYNPGDSDIRGQRFDASGVAVGQEFVVNTYTTGFQYFPSVAAGLDGRFVVVWASGGQIASGDVFGRAYDNDGAVSGEFQVNQFTTSFQSRPKIAGGGNGDFVVVWESNGQDGDQRGVMARRFGPDGTPRGNEFPVNQATTGNQQAAAVAADSGGDFVVVWQSEGQEPGGTGQGIFARRFGSSGVPLGAEFQVNSYVFGDQTNPRIASDPKGNVLVTWETQGFDGSGAVAARRYDSAGNPVSPQPLEFQVNATSAGLQLQAVPAAGPSGRFAFAWTSPNMGGNADVFARFGSPLPVSLTVDPALGAAPAAPAGVPGNGVLEPGESVLVAPRWLNNGPAAVSFAGTASGFTGPAGANYTIVGNSANYGNVAPGNDSSCLSTGACFALSVSDPSPRPLTHWDARFAETLSVGGMQPWRFHVGASFPDVFLTDPFYPFIENLFHNGVTSGCGDGNYCPGSPVTRAQMAVFLLKTKHNANFVPPACTGMFTDVVCPSGFADWIEELAREGITGGCGGSAYCPNNAVTRAQMAVFLLKAKHGASYTPPGCTGIFLDVACPSPFADWIERLSAEQITGGCGGNNYCPGNPNTRGQMAVFLVRTFGLLLYGP